MRDTQTLGPLERGPFADKNVANGVERRHRSRLAGQRFVRGRHFAQQLDVVWAIPRFVQLELFVEFTLFDIRENQNPPTVQWPAICAAHDGGRQLAMLIVISMHG